MAKINESTQGSEITRDTIIQVINESYEGKSNAETFIKTLANILNEKNFWQVQNNLKNYNDDNQEISDDKKIMPLYKKYGLIVEYENKITINPLAKVLLLKLLLDAKYITFLKNEDNDSTNINHIEALEKLVNRAYEEGEEIDLKNNEALALSQINDDYNDFYIYDEGEGEYTTSISLIKLFQLPDDAFTNDEAENIKGDSIGGNDPKGNQGDPEGEDDPQDEGDSGCSSSLSDAFEGLHIEDQNDNTGASTPPLGGSTPESPSDLA